MVLLDKVLKAQDRQIEPLVVGAVVTPAQVELVRWAKLTIFLVLQWVVRLLVLQPLLPHILVVVEAVEANPKTLMDKVEEMLGQEEDFCLS